MLDSLLPKLEMNGFGRAIQRLKQAPGRSLIISYTPQDDRFRYDRSRYDRFRFDRFRFEEAPKTAPDIENQPIVAFNETLKKTFGSGDWRLEVGHTPLRAIVGLKVRQGNVRSAVHMDEFVH